LGRYERKVEREKVASAVWIGLKRNSGADMGGGDNWGIGWRDRRRAAGEEKRGAEIRGKERGRGERKATDIPITEAETRDW